MGSMGRSEERSHNRGHGQTRIRLRNRSLRYRRYCWHPRGIFHRIQPSHMWRSLHVINAGTTALTRARRCRWPQPASNNRCPSPTRRRLLAGDEYDDRDISVIRGSGSGVWTRTRTTRVKVWRAANYPTPERRAGMALSASRRSFKIPSPELVGYLELGGRPASSLNRSSQAYPRPLWHCTTPRSVCRGPRCAGRPRAGSRGRSRRCSSARS